MLEPVNAVSDETDILTDTIRKQVDDSSSSDSDVDKYYVLSKKNRLFGRQQPLHVLLGGGKSADILLWRNKQTSAGIFFGLTFMWILFEWIGYHLITFVCHSLILSLATLFLWSNLSSFAHVSPPDFPEVLIPEHLFLNVALSLRCEFNMALKALRDVAAGKDLKKFLQVVLALWVISVVGIWFSFLTLFYLVSVTILIAPVLYERNEDSVDAFAEKALVELKKQYAVFDEKVLSKLPKIPFPKDDNKID